MRLARLTLRGVNGDWGSVYVNPHDVILVSANWVAEPPYTVVALRDDDDGISVSETVDEAARIIMGAANTTGGEQ
jgi:hypothetical protein